MTRLIDADALKKAFEDCTGECACCIHNTNDFNYCGLIDDAPTVERQQGRPIFNREELEQTLNYWYEHLEVGNEEQNKAVWCAINAIRYCIEHNLVQYSSGSSDYQEGGAE